MLAKSLSGPKSVGDTFTFPFARNRKWSRHIKSALDQHARPFSRNCNIVLESSECDVVLLVLEGWLSVSKSLSDGQNQIIDFALPGDIVTPAAADATTASVTVEAVTDATIAVIPNASWDRMLQNWPELRHHVDHIMAGQDARRAERMLRLGKGSAEMRVAYALLELCVRLKAIDQAPDCVFHLPITQQYVGDFMGLTSVHVCRTMRRMVRNNVLTMLDHMDIEIIDRDALAEMAGVTASALEQEIIPRMK